MSSAPAKRRIIAIERFGPYSLNPYSDSPTSLLFSGLGANVRAAK
jgi:hypothetical protein